MANSARPCDQRYRYALEDVAKFLEKLNPLTNRDLPFLAATNKAKVVRELLGENNE